MFDSTVSLRSPKIIKQSKQELQSFYHYSKIVKLKELSQKPTQLSINYNSSQHNSSAMRLSDHISNFEFFIQQNSRYNQHRVLREQFSQQLSQHQIDKLNREKHQANQKRIEQSLNKYKFNHSLDHPQQSITRRRIIRLSSESSTQSRPISKMSQHIEQIQVETISKKQSIKNIVNHFQTDQSPQNIIFEEIIQQQIQQQIDIQQLNDIQPQNNHEDKQNEQEEEEIAEEVSIQEEELDEKPKNNVQIRKKQENVAQKQTEVIQQEKVQKATKELQQTKKKLKAQITQQLTRKESELMFQVENQTEQSSKRIEPSNSEAYIKKILEEQQKYKEKQQEIQQSELKKQQERLQEIEQIQVNIERIKNKKEDFSYKAEQNTSEEEFIRQQQLLKLQQLEKQQKEQELIVEEQRKKEEEIRQMKKLEEARNQEIEEKRKQEIAILIQKQKEEIEKKEQEEKAKQPPQIEKQKSVLMIQRQPTILESKRSQEEMQTSARQYKQYMDDQIKKEKEDQERLELESLDFVDFMLKANNIYDADYQRFKICEAELKKIKQPPNDIEEDDENIYYSLKKWKQISKQCSIKIFGKNIITII